MINIHSFLGYWVEFSFDIYPFLLVVIIPIKTSFNAEADKDQILKDNQNKSGIYMWTNLNKIVVIKTSMNKERKLYIFYIFV